MERFIKRRGTRSEAICPRCESKYTYRYSQNEIVKYYKCFDCKWTFKLPKK